MNSEKSEKKSKRRAKQEVREEPARVEAVMIAEDTAAEQSNVASDEEPDVAENERIRRYDLVISSEGAGYRPPRTALAAIVRQLAFRGFANPVDEAVAEKWAEIYFEPGPAAHEMFIDRAYDSDAPVFRELVMKVSDRPFFCEFSETPKRPLYWSIELYGSRFTHPIGAFRKLFLDAFNLRIAVSVTDAGPLPEHKIVPEDEQPVAKKKRERGSGIAGIEVEEV